MREVAVFFGVLSVIFGLGLMAFSIREIMTTRPQRKGEK